MFIPNQLLILWGIGIFFIELWIDEKYSHTLCEKFRMLDFFSYVKTFLFEIQKKVFFDWKIWVKTLYIGMYISLLKAMVSMLFIRSSLEFIFSTIVQHMFNIPSQKKKKNDWANALSQVLPHTHNTKSLLTNILYYYFMITNAMIQTMKMRTKSVCVHQIEQSNVFIYVGCFCLLLHTNDFIITITTATATTMVIHRNEWKLNTEKNSNKTSPLHNLQCAKWI